MKAICLVTSIIIVLVGLASCGRRAVALRSAVGA